MPVPAILASSIPSLLLLALAVRLRRHRGPERWLTIGFLFAGLSATPKLIAVRLLQDGDVSNPVFAVSALTAVGMGLAAGCIGFFVCEVFRKGETWARVLAWSAMCGGVLPGLFMFAELGQGMETSGLALLGGAIRPLPFAWAFAECLRYAQLMRRRQAMGLADPVVADRFRLWSIWTGVLAVLPWFILAARGLAARVRANGLDPGLELPWLLPLILGVATVSLLAMSAAVVLSFFPPAWYETRVRGRSAA